ncbi:site-specific integrase, partial [uncultured Bacteroides sp.]|uniref:site-specific integrase n=1 Tax=uncultured Bacteroides sp. TaxID=162156 RepID=UPI0025B70B1A
MKKSTFKVLFLIRRNQVNKDGKCAIIIKITVDGEYERLNSTLSIEPDLWDAAASKAIGRSSKIAEFNKRIEDMRHVLKEHYYDLLNRHGYVTAEMVKNAFTGVTAKEESLVTLYLQHLEDTKKLIGISKANPTYQKYERMYRRVVEFMKKKYNITDIPLREIKYQFIVDLEFFLRTEYGYSQNTTYKCMKFFKQVINKAIRAGLIFVDPFNGYKISVQRVDRGFLTEDDLKKMMDKEFASKRLEHVRDIFVFACFTGLAYIDLANLRVDNIQKMFDGRLWIVTHRQKTNTKVTVPLLPPALKILKKYEGKYLDGQLMPIITNQKLNCYLNEIADSCGIEKNLTFHLARHTFATTMTLGKGVPIESVSKMLGHTNIQTTQIYARITNSKISQDMENLA